MGSRRFKELIFSGRIEEAAKIGRIQVRNGARVLDVCMAHPDRNELLDMERFVEILNRMVKASLMIDSIDHNVIEAALKRCQGKCIVNSIHLKEGEKRFERMVPLLKKYNAAVVVSCMDEDPVQGMAMSRQRKIEIAKRSYDLLVNKYSISPRKIIFDALVFPIRTGNTPYGGSAFETIEGIRLIKQTLPSTKTILGISNISFGLPSTGREVLNAVFLYHCAQAGLDYVIVNVERMKPYASIPEKERRLAEDLTFSRGPDPLTAFSEYFQKEKAALKR